MAYNCQNGAYICHVYKNVKDYYGYLIQNYGAYNSLKNENITKITEQEFYSIIFCQIYSKQSMRNRTVVFYLSIFFCQYFKDDQIYSNYKVNINCGTSCCGGKY